MAGEAMMRASAAAFLIACLLVTGTGSLVAQEASAPSSVVGLGGRIEMTQHGFALTFPEDWAWARHSTLDIESLVEKLVKVTDPAFAPRQRTLLAHLEEAFPVIGFPYPEDERQGGSCSGGVLHSDVSLDAFVAGIIDHHGGADETTAGGATAANVTIPAGNAARIDIVQIAPIFGTAMDSSLYALKTDGLIYLFFCGGDGEAPDDRWFSIAETFEFLPAEE
jgi:hypothetical protein